METYRTRLETGLTFLEFNYVLLQAYDFLELYRRYGCTLQIGGSDQWSNVLAGAHLIQRVEAVEAFALTWPLLMDASGRQDGQDRRPAVRCGSTRRRPRRTSSTSTGSTSTTPTCARDLAVFTFLPVAEIDALTAAGGASLRDAKRRLALEVTALVHGREAAADAERAAQALFGERGPPGGAVEGVATVEIDRARLDAGIPAARSAGGGRAGRVRATGPGS